MNFESCFRKVPRAWRGFNRHAAEGAAKVRSRIAAEVARRGRGHAGQLGVYAGVTINSRGFPRGHRSERDSTSRLTRVRGGRDAE